MKLLHILTRIGQVSNLLSKRLVELRKNKKLTQQDIADKLHITRSTYAQYEIGRRIPEYSTLEKLADFFECSIDYLVGRENTFVDEVKSGEGVKEQASAYGKDSGMAFYGGGKDWTDEEVEFAEKMIQMLREQKDKEKKKNQKDK